MHLPVCVSQMHNVSSVLTVKFSPHCELTFVGLCIPTGTAVSRVNAKRYLQVHLYSKIVTQVTVTLTVSLECVAAFCQLKPYMFSVALPFRWLTARVRQADHQLKSLLVVLSRSFRALQTCAISCQMCHHNTDNIYHCF